MILSGSKLSKSMMEDLKQEILIHDLNPGLGIIIVGDRADSILYVNMKTRACKELGIINYDVHLSEMSTQQEIINEIHKMNINDNIHGILVQLPLPKHIDEDFILSHVSVDKDVDGFNIENMGLLAINNPKAVAPCTPEGCVKLLEHYNIEIEGKDVVVVGCGKVVGKPLGLMLLNRNATVQFCHIKTKNLKEKTKLADILVVGCGVPNLITKEHVKEGVVVIDIGINKILDLSKKRGYRIVGDVNFNEVKTLASHITPVPGGVGPMTISMLMKHTIESSKRFKTNLFKENNNVISSCYF